MKKRSWLLGLALAVYSCRPAGSAGEAGTGAYPADSSVQAADQAADEMKEPTKGNAPLDASPAPADSPRTSLAQRALEADTIGLDFFARDTSELEKQLIAQGLVDLHSVDPSIQVSLAYATTDNFLNENVYGELTRCYLQPVVAEMLAEAQRLLKAERPDWSLLVFDGVRPRSVQRKMWAIVKGTPQQKYVAPPSSGSMHNYGAAVDLGLSDAQGAIVDMGTPFDFFGPLAQPRYEAQYLESGELTQEQLNHRLLLRNAMRQAGFHMIMSEWWHFNAFSREEVKQRFTPVE